MKRSPSVNSLARSLAFSPSSTRARTYATEVHQHHHHQLWPPLQQLPIELLTPPDRSPSLHHLNTYEPATLKSRHDWRLTAYSRQRALSNPPSWLRPMRVPASKTIRSRHDGEQGAAIDLYSNRWRQMLLWETESGRARAIQQARLATTSPTQADLFAASPHRQKSKDEIEVHFTRSRESELALFTRRMLYPECEVVVAPGNVRRSEWPEEAVLVGKVSSITKRSITIAFAARDAARIVDPKQPYCLRTGWDGTVNRRTERALDHIKRDAAYTQRSHEAPIDIFDTQSKVPKEHIMTGSDLVDIIIPPPSSSPSPKQAFVDHLHSTAVFADNQLIHSWAKRHLRPHPLTLPGDPDLGLNPDQLRALALSLHSRLSVIQGPPGTGKTITIVRLLDLLKGHFRVPDTILVCTPTHVSVEHILQRTLKDTKLKPIILTPEHRTASINRRHTLDAKLEAHSAYYSYQDLLEKLDSSELAPKDVKLLRDKARKLSAKMAQDVLSRSDVAFSTMAGMSVEDGFSSYADFRVVILDEAAQCSESTSLIPLVKGCAHLTLVGDHKQLPAIVSSERAEAEGFGRSLFERLIDTTEVPKITIRTQYRMHSALARFPNKCFYANQLIDAGHLKGRPLPPYLEGFDTQHPYFTAHRRLVFMHHDGVETKQQPSRINRSEADVIARTVIDLLRRFPQLPGTEIGVITPYAPQRRLLSLRINELAVGDSNLMRRANDVEVNTVDGFQGREVDIALLSTVRSLSHDLRFISQSRRVCVALTRARHATILVGNEHALTDRGWDGSGLWATLVRECRATSSLLYWTDVEPRLFSPPATSML